MYFFLAFYISSSLSVLLCFTISVVFSFFLSFFPVSSCQLRRVAEGPGGKPRREALRLEQEEPSRGEKSPPRPDKMFSSQLLPAAEACSHPIKARCRVEKAFLGHGVPNRDPLKARHRVGARLFLVVAKTVGWGGRFLSTRGDQEADPGTERPFGKEPKKTL